MSMNQYLNSFFEVKKNLGGEEVPIFKKKLHHI